MSRWCVGLTLAACGRVGFDAVGDGGAAADASADATTVRPADFDIDLVSGTLGPVTFNRPSPASYIDSDRVLRYANANEPRFDHAPRSGEPRGLLLEGTTDNLAFFSEQLDSGGDWFTNEVVSGAVTIGTNVALAPDGTMSAEEITETDSADFNRRAQIIAISNDASDYVCSAFMKTGTSPVRGFGCELLNGANVQTNMDVDLDMGTVTRAPVGAQAYGLQKYANGWARVWITVRNNASGNDIAVLSFWSYLSDDAVNGSAFVWGAQFEKGIGPTSYIPTPSNAPVTRAADITSITDLTWLDPTAGSLLVAAELEAVRSRDQHAACFKDIGPGYTCISRYGPGGTAALLYQGTPIVEGSTWTGEPSSVVIIQEPPNLTFYDPGAITTVSAPAAGAPYIELILGNDGVAWLDGWVRRFAYWRVPLTSEERTSLGVK